MARSPLQTVFLFDAGYLAPALVSVASFFAHADPTRHAVAMVYLASGTPQDAQVGVVLQRFAAGIAARHPGASLELVTLQGTVFDSYVQRHHFSQAILYKAILPQAFAHWPHMLLLDCGMIFGRQLPGFLAAVEQHIGRDKPPAVAAFCVEADGPLGLPQGLRALPHHGLYPDGGTLYFDTRRFAEAGVYARFVATFQAYRDHLQYAEQDLLCLALRGDELQALPEAGTRCRIDLAGTDSWQHIAQHQALHASGEHFYIKHIGSFKPWRRWVLHPSKAIYLREQQALAGLIGDDALAALRDADLFPQNAGFLAQQLLHLEAHYAQPPSS